MGGFSGGVYSRYHNWNSDRLANLDITDTRMDEEDDGFAAALSRCILKDGTQSITADITMSNHRITNLADAMTADQALNMGTGDGRYVQKTSPAMSGGLVITTTSANALVVGPAGLTNPTLQVNCAPAGAVTGLTITPQAAAGTIVVDVTSTAANEGMFLRMKGTGGLTVVGGTVSLAGCTGQLNAPMIDGTWGVDALHSLQIGNKTLNATGESAIAGIAFLCNGKYGVKLGLRADGVFGLGGWSAATYKWYVDCVGGNMTAAGAVICAGINTSGAITCTGNSLSLTGAAPIITMADTGWGSRYVFADGGSIGFLTSAQGWALQVDNAGNTTATGNVAAYSDARLKDNVETIPAALAKVRQMRGVSYLLRSTGLPGSGVIAQELQKIAPELVSESADGMLSVAYGNITGYLIEAVKELAGIIDNMLTRQAKGMS